MSFVPPGRQPRTQIRHLREGRRMLRSCAADPQTSRLEALIAALEARDGPITRETLRAYRSAYEAVGAAILKVDQRPAEEGAALLSDYNQRVDAGLTRLNILHSQSQGGGPRKRRSPKRVPVAVVNDILKDLQEHGVRQAHLPSAWGFFYIIAASRTGIRPCEMMGLVEGEDGFHVRTAKLKNGRQHRRPIPFAALPDNAIAAARVISRHLPRMGFLEFERFRNRVAEAVARSCERVGVDRVSLYAFRHIAITTWRAAGVSAADIAALAGHFDLLTASRHYGGYAGRDWLASSPLAGNPGAVANLPREMPQVSPHHTRRLAAMEAREELTALQPHHSFFQPVSQAGDLLPPVHAGVRPESLPRHQDRQQSHQASPSLTPAPGWPAGHAVGPSSGAPPDDPARPLLETSPEPQEAEDAVVQQLEDEWQLPDYPNTRPPDDPPPPLLGTPPEPQEAEDAVVQELEDGWQLPDYPNIRSPGTDPAKSKLWKDHLDKVDARQIGVQSLPASGKQASGRPGLRSKENPTPAPKPGGRAPP